MTMMICRPSWECTNERRRWRSDWWTWGWSRKSRWVYYLTYGHWTIPYWDFDSNNLNFAQQPFLSQISITSSSTSAVYLSVKGRSGTPGSPRGAGQGSRSSFYSLSQLLWNHHWSSFYIIYELYAYYDEISFKGGKQLGLSPSMVNSTAKRGAFHFPCFSCFQYLIFALPHLSHILIPFSQVGHSRCPRRVEGALQRRGAQEQVALLRCRGQLLGQFIFGSAFWTA